MTETYTLLNKGRIDQDNIHEDDYVTYTTPSPEDKDWSLVFYAHQYPHRDAPSHYFRCWKFVDDKVAQEEYPIFRRLAMKRNWEPMDEIPPIPEPPCPHSSTSMIGHSAITRKPVFRCNKCQVLVLHDRMPIPSGHYTVTNADEVRRLLGDEAERNLKMFQDRFNMGPNHR
ncbi:hypothetical protein SEA_HUWBERT_13 [Microbacterium phage Huwbert]|nr:hypothetical protein SEA_HUWBERT_13 [Microbacterium phage Huwbert]